jgi:hypothetical protein
VAKAAENIDVTRGMRANADVADQFLAGNLWRYGGLSVR